MSSLRLLNAEIKQIADLFKRTHDVFQVIEAKSNEILIIFVSPSEHHLLRCAISNSYPNELPKWTTESKNVAVQEIVSNLSLEQYHTKFKVIAMIRNLLAMLCNKFEMGYPKELQELGRHLPPEDDTDDSSGDDAAASVVASSSSVKNASGDHLLQTGRRSLVIPSMPPPPPNDKKVLNVAVNQLQAANVEANSSKLDQTAGEPDQTAGEPDQTAGEPEKTEPSEQPSEPENAQTSSSGKSSVTENVKSTRASKRLMKEFQAICNSDNVKKGCYKAEIVDDNLFEWEVTIYQVDPDSNLHADLQLLKQQGKRDSITLRINFKKDFPFDPPFVRVTYPVIQGGYVLDGGAICLELLTASGWSSVYTVESMILQVIAAFAKGLARVHIGGSTDSYNYPNALRTFSRVSIIHEAGGWFTPPDDEG